MEIFVLKRNPIIFGFAEKSIPILHIYAHPRTFNNHARYYRCHYVLYECTSKENRTYIVRCCAMKQNENNKYICESRVTNKTKNAMETYARVFQTITAGNARYAFITQMYNASGILSWGFLLFVNRGSQ